ncbi:MAG: enoyl-CoA hydratase/isomerase family protein [Pirellulales bacterium]|nr:enoyl-CoA hydratase/isomerase family protein [Pirellulales bacterium]
MSLPHSISLGTIDVELDGSMARVWLNRPQVRNALSRQLVADLGSAIEFVAAHEEIGALVLAGRGEAFCAGADLREIGSLAADEAVQLELEGAAILDRLAALPLITIAALHGYAVGGGFSLSLYCDVRLAAEGTRMGFPPAARHWLPPWGLAQLAGWVGVARAQQIVLAGGMFEVTKAERWGLVDEIVALGDMPTRATEVARELSAARREVISEVRSFFAQLRGTPNAKWDRLAGEGFGRLFASAPAQRAVQEFVARARNKDATE